MVSTTDAANMEVITVSIRKATLAGSWYPKSPEGCKQEFAAFQKELDVRPVADKELVGGIVPHAGWYFSGSLAYNVIRCLQADPPPDVIVVFGLHLHAGAPFYIMTKGAWETPFGPISIASEFADELTRSFVFEDKTSHAFAGDNTIEVQLPLIKHLFKDVKFVPIGAPPVKKSLEIGKTAVDIAKQMGLRLKVLGSTDLTHYGYNYGFLPQGSGQDALNWVKTTNDAHVVNAMLAMDPERVIQEALSHQNACCAGAAAAAIAAGKQMGATQAQTIAYATSYDKSPGDSFVGYVGIVF